MVRREEQACWLCGQLVDKDLRYPHPLSFSVDHVIPASLSPELQMVRSNLRAAHRICNLKRGARVRAGETTRLRITPLLVETW